MYSPERYFGNGEKNDVFCKVMEGIGGERGRKIVKMVRLGSWFKDKNITILYILQATKS